LEDVLEWLLRSEDGRRHVGERIDFFRYGLNGIEGGGDFSRERERSDHRWVGLRGWGFWINAHVKGSFTRFWGFVEDGELSPEPKRSPEQDAQETSVAERHGTNQTNAPDVSWRKPEEP